MEYTVTSDYRKWMAFHDRMVSYQHVTDLQQAIRENRAVGISSCTAIPSAEVKQYEITTQDYGFVLQLNEVGKTDFLDYIATHYLAISPEAAGAKPAPENESSLPDESVDEQSQVKTGKVGAFFYHRHTFRHAIGYAIVAFVLGQVFILPQFFDLKLPDWLRWAFIAFLAAVSHLAVRNYRSQFLIGGIRYGTVFRIIMALYGLVFGGFAVEITAVDFVTDDEDLSYFAMAGLAIVIAGVGMVSGWFISVFIYFLNGGKVVTDPSSVKYRS